MPSARRRPRLPIVLLVAGMLLVFVPWALAGFSIPPSPPPLPGGPPPSPQPQLPGTVRVIAAGDIAVCGSDWDEWTARSVEALDGTVLALGDNAYEQGSATQYRDCYDPSWGVFRARTRPVPGNHDWATAGAAGYLGYFGPDVAPGGRTWYAYDLGSWRLYALDADCPVAGVCDADAQLAWLAADLVANPRACVLAYWHQPRFSSGRHGDDPAVQPMWQLLADAGADVVLNGHDHLYERFAPLDAAGRPAAAGMREFVVGTGGGGLYEVHNIKVGSEVRDATTFGVLAIDLRDGSYDWRFIPVPGTTGFTDSGSTACH